jgi:hypothetical protein
MKKLYLLSVIILFSFFTKAQTIVYDSVSMDPGYQNEIYYSFYSGAKPSAIINEWDLAFSTNAMDVGLRINSINGANVWSVPSTDTSGWSTLDSAGYQSWQELHNTDTAMFYGAFNINAIGGYDFSWGVYNPTTHEVIGDSLYLIKVTDQLSNVYFKKLWIVKRADNATHDWIIRYANLDNSGDVTVSIPTTGYVSKNFIYYSITNDSIIDREPPNTDWDILFTRYTTDVGGGFYYPVAGVYSNYGVEVADVRPVDVATTNSDAPYLNLYTGNMTEIGYDWKSFNMSTSMWEIEDSLVYFVKTNAGEVYKLVLTGFDGASTGNVYFNKTLISTTGINNIPGAITGLTVYPNPAKETVNVLFSSGSAASVNYSMTDITGKKVLSSEIKTSIGLNSLQINAGSLTKGIYILQISDGRETVNHKIVIL